MLKFVLVAALVALVACSHKPRPDERAHFKIKRLNVLSRNVTGGVPFGIGTKHPKTDLVWFKKMRHGEMTELTKEEKKGINIYMKVKACKHDDESDETLERHRCKPYISGFVKVDSPSCCLKGKYLLGYGHHAKGFRVAVRGCRND